MTPQDWARHIVYRRESLVTTWKFRMALVATVAVALILSRSLWIPAVGRSLVCDTRSGAADAAVLDNFDEDYVLFEQAATMRETQPALRVLVPAKAASDVAAGFVDVMARIAHLPNVEIVQVRQIEPISLNAAFQIRDYLVKEKIGAVAIVTPAFRSKRSALIYQTVFAPAGIATSCVPVFGDKTPDTWTRTWHGIQEVTMQLAKLEYYRFWVLPFRTPAAAGRVTAGEITTSAPSAP